MDLQKRLLSKQWQDRIKAYEDLGDLLVRDAPGGDAVARYAPYLKRIVADNANPRAQEAALSTLVSFLQHLSSQREPARYAHTPHTHTHTWPSPLCSPRLHR
jgi:hypothetical protein